MAQAAPSIYLLDGEDEFTIHRTIGGLVARLGDASISELNTTRLDGKTATFAQVESAVRSLPFLADRRVIILTHPEGIAKSPEQQERYKRLFNEVQPSTALVLVEFGLLTSEQDRRRGKLSWLEEWAAAAPGGQVYRQSFVLPSGPEMVRWIQERAKTAGGQFTPQAAMALADLLGDEPRLVNQEINKLLEYVNYARPVERDDVAALTPLTAQVGDFALVNAVRQKDRRQAQAILHRMLEEDAPLMIFQQIVTEFRSLLQARDVLDHGGGEKEIARQLGYSDYRAKKVTESARRYTSAELEKVFHRLIELDEAQKTSQMEGELALDLLVIELTG